MQEYILRRLLLIIPTMFIVTLIVFSMLRVMPGDVVIAQLAGAPNFQPEDVDALREKIGLNDPWLTQYFEWLGGAVHGDLGQSLWSSKDVSVEIIDRAPVTLELAIMSFVLANIVALTVGVISAVRQDTIVDYVLRVISIGGLSVPAFFIATLVIVLGGRYFEYLPPLTYVPFTDDPLTNLRQFLPPASIIAIASSASIMRLVRSSMLEVLRQDYIRTAWSKGLRERTVIYRHALKNALMPVVTLQGFQLNFLLSGSVVIEIIFSLPGLGRLMYDSFLQRDYTLVQGMAFVFGLVFVMVNLIVDLTYAWLDPRVKY